MTGLEAAIAQKRWEAAWLYLMLGVTEAASKLPPETLSALLDLLAGEEETTTQALSLPRRPAAATPPLPKRERGPGGEVHP
jgi:hypothetical protein